MEESVCTDSVKRQQIDENVEKIKFTDLNMDCLEMIFNRLSPSDLLSVADTNEQFRSVACFIFDRKKKKI